MLTQSYASVRRGDHDRVWWTGRYGCLHLGLLCSTILDWGGYGPLLTLPPIEARSRTCPVPQEELTLVWLLLIVVVVVTYLIQRNGWHWIPPASCAMVLGIAAGIVGRIAGAVAGGLCVPVEGWGGTELPRLDPSIAWPAQT